MICDIDDIIRVAAWERDYNEDVMIGEETRRNARLSELEGDGEQEWGESGDGAHVYSMPLTQAHRQPIAQRPPAQQHLSYMTPMPQQEAQRRPSWWARAQHQQRHDDDVVHSSHEAPVRRQSWLTRVVGGQVYIPHHQVQVSPHLSIHGQHQPGYQAAQATSHHEAADDNSCFE